MRLAVASRSVIKTIAVGSVPPDEKKIWNRLTNDTGIQIELYERGAQSGQEQGVDQCLQTHMLRALADEDEPKVAVLLTGDGKGFEEKRGFLADLERMYDKGWGVEVLSWEHSCKPELRGWADQNGTFVSLDRYYDSITYREGVRDAKVLSLTSRSRSTARIIPQNKQIQELEDKIAKLKQENENLKAQAKKNRQKEYGKRVAQRNRKHF